MTKIRRRFRESDRAWVAEKLGDQTPIDVRGHRVEVVEEGADRGFALWSEPIDSDGIPPILGPVVTAPARRDMFYAALLSVIESLVDKGYRTGRAYISDGRVVSMLQRDLGDVIKVTPIGRNVKTDGPGYWQVDVDPSDALAVLRRLSA